jgi:hypothetical protein
MIKSIKILAVITSAIALLPSVSFADTISDKTQSVNQESIVFGSNNTVRSDVRQSIINVPTDRHSTSVDTNAQRAETKAIVIGEDNTSTQSIVQETSGRHRSK